MALVFAAAWAAAAWARFVLSDAASPVFYRYAVVAGEAARVLPTGRVEGDVHADGDVDVDPLALVEGDASAVGEVDVDGTVTGTVTEGVAPVGLPDPFDEVTARAIADRIFEDDRRFVDAVIDDVVFVAGSVEIRGSLEGSGTIISGGAIRLRPDLPGPGKSVAATSPNGVPFDAAAWEDRSFEADLDPGPDAKLAPPPLAPETRLSLIASEDISLSFGRRFRGVLHAGRDVDVGVVTVVEGVVVAGRRARVWPLARVSFLDPDEAPPEVAILRPQEGELVDALALVVEAVYSDELSGVELASVRLLVDGVDRTTEAAVGADRLLWQPELPLAGGPHAAELVVADRSGKVGRATVAFEVLAEPPEVTITAPVDVRLINQPAPAITVALSGTALDLASFRLLADNVDLSFGCLVAADGATCQPPPLGAGVHALSAEIRNLAGVAAADTAGFEIVLDSEPPRLEIVAPSGPTLVNTRSPLVELRFADDDAGVAPESLAVTLDGVDLTSACTVASGTALCPSPELAAGAHRIEAAVADAAGLTATAAHDFTLVIDETPPLVAITEPTAPSLALPSGLLAVRVAFEDDGLGVDGTTFGLTVGGLDRSVDCEIGDSGADCELPIGGGSHRIVASVEDLAGNSGEDAIDVDLAVDPEPPAVAILSPVAGAAVALPPPIEVTYQDAGSGIDPAAVRLRLGSQELTGGCTVTESAASCPPPALGEGAHTLVVELTDRAGNPAAAAATFTLQLRDRRPPELTIVAPSAGTVVVGGVLAVEVAFADPSGIAAGSFLALVDGEDVSGTCLVTGEGASCQVPLLAGAHLLLVEVRDTEGNLATARRAFDLQLQLPIRITEPPSGLLTTGDAVILRGEVSLEATEVRVGGVSAVVAEGEWVAEDVPLREGANLLTAVAASPLGAGGAATVTVVRDTLRPQVVLFTPKDGSVVHSQQILVTGEVHDPASSSSAQAPPEVRVNGVAAPVEQRAFMVPGFLLQPGENVLRAEAVDTAGNVGAAEVRVTYQPAAALRLEEILGNDQGGAVGEELAEPLVVRAADFAGQPLAGRVVRFEVTRGDGEVSSFPESDRSVEVRTDSDGLAQVFYRLGGRSGRGNHEVTATSPGIAGEVVFCASADPGPPQRLKRIAGHNPLGVQEAVADAPAPYPLLSQLFDRFGNPVPGVAVTYTAAAGGGHFDGSPTGVATTDAEGKAAAVFTLGPAVGPESHLVRATVDGLPESGATFLFSGVAPSDGPTRLAGLVLDNQDRPLPGVTVRLGGGSPETTTDAAGRFALVDVPVGTVHLEVDGSTAARPGVWPTLTFDLTTVRGRETTLGMPIRLPQLDVAGTRTVGGVEDVTLQMVGVPGAELTVAAGSATFPDGSTTGEVSFTQVLRDKVPMLAPLGSDFMLAWTVQPAGVLFDPPARIAIPNLGAAPGSVVDIFSFDHDLGEFVTAGTAAVSADGLQLVSTPGSGISKAGWGGCVAPPPPDADACHPSKCQICEPGSDRPVPKCGDCSSCQGDGSCKPKEVKELTILANGEDGTETNVVVGKDQDVSFRIEAESDCRLTYEWSFGDGETSTAAAPSHEFEDTGTFTVRLDVECSGCPASDSDELRIRVIELDLEIEELPEETEESPNEEEPGALLVVNNDDDNGNETLDHEEDGPVDDEDNLTELKVTFDNSVDNGEVRLEATAGGGKVRIWEDDSKETELALPKTWDAAEDEVPETLWVEAVDGSELQGVELTLSYTNDAEADIEDKVVLTLLEVELFAAPDFAETLTADRGIADVVAVALYRDPADTERLVPVAEGSEFRWEIDEGSGVVAPRSAPTEEGGLVGTLLAPDLHDHNVVQAVLTKLKLEAGAFPGDPEIEPMLQAPAGPFLTIPGPPHTIALDASPQSVVADGTQRIVVTATVTDEVGNPVDNATPIAWAIEGSPIPFERTDSLIFGGVATAELRAPLVDVDPTVVVTSETAGASLTIATSPVTGSLSGSSSRLDLEAGDTAAMTLSTDASDGTPVSWTTSNGSLSSTATSVFGGQSGVTLSTAGGRPGRFVVTATVGRKLFFFDGRFFVPGSDLQIDIPVLVADAASDGVENVVWADGSVHPVPFFASSTVRVSGPAGGFVAVGVPGIRQVEAFNFETVVDGAVPGLAGGHALEVGGAELDGEVRHTGEASLFFDGTDVASIADADDFDFDSSFRASIAFHPESLSAATLVAKGNVWSIELLEDGRVRATVSAAAGTFEVTSTNAAVAEAWSVAILEVGPGGLTLALDGQPAPLFAALGALAIDAQPIRVGEGFAGHLDDLAFQEQDAGGVGIVLDGLDAFGRVAVGPAGEATLTLRSTGTTFLAAFETQVFPIAFAAQPSAASAALPLDKMFGPQGQAYAALVNKETWVQVFDVVLAFTGLTDPQNGVEIGANIAGGILIVGDVGSILKNLYRLGPWTDKKFSWPEVVLSSLGLLTEFAVGIGEVADVPISAARAIVARIGASPLGEVIAKRMWRLVTSGRGIPEAEKAFLELVARSDGVAEGLADLVKSEEGYEAVLAGFEKLRRLPCGLARAPVAPSEKRQEEASTPFVKGCADDFVTSLSTLARTVGPEAAEVVGRAISRASDDVLALADDVEVAVTKLGSIVSRSAVKDPETYARILNNRRLFSQLDDVGGRVGGYGLNQLVDDLDLIVDIPGADDLIKALRNANKSKARGTVYELQVAAFFKRAGSNVEALSKRAFQGTDIDAVVDGAYVQVKNGTNALGTARSGAIKTVMFVFRASADAGGRVPLRYVFPEETVVHPLIQRVFDLYRVEVTHVAFKRLFEALEQAALRVSGEEAEPMRRRVGEGARGRRR